MAKKDSRIKLNLISSVTCQVVLIAISFLLPKLYREQFGSDVNGVLDIIKQIFTYMCLLEAGVGLATTQALYKRIGKQDYPSASAVLSATHSFYVRTGFLYGAIVLVIAVVFSFVIDTPVKNGYVLFALIILNALPSLFSYFVLAKYRILMEADGRNYVLNNSEIVLHLASNAGKLLVLHLAPNLILIQLVYCSIELVRYGYLYIYAKRRYQWLDLKTKPDFEAISQKNSVLVHQISGMVFNNTDIMLIPIFCKYASVNSFGMTSVYSLYQHVFFAPVQALITRIASSFTFALGQMFHVDREKFDKLFHTYETFYIMTTFLIYTLMAVFLLPLLQIYTKNMTDAPYINTTLLFLFVLMQLLANGKLPVSGIIEYAGDFKKTRSHAIWEMGINLTISIVALIYIGICGALIGTIAALLYRGIVTIYHSNKKILKRSQMQTYKILITNGAVFTIVMAIFFVDTFENLSFLKLLLNGMLHSVWIAGLYILANLIFHRDAFKTMLDLYREKKKQ
ncbi:MAG: hypothetical protein E7397_00930 [Ruminococcaceae bacterium]|nr:hypothetical protein [Oscillospiraceae bacterium]